MRHDHIHVHCQIFYLTADLFYSNMQYGRFEKRGEMREMTGKCENMTDNLSENVHTALLYDFYGELLNERQREIMESRLYDDLTLTEIAESAGITKQAVSDMIKKCETKLSEYEDRLKLLEKFLAIRQKAEKIVEFSGEDSRIKTLAAEIIDLM